MNSLRKIAKHLELSHATVSAALRGLPGVKAATRERVLQAAEQHGYHINPLASALMASMRRMEKKVFRGVLVLLRPVASRSEQDSEERTRRRIASGARRRAGELGYDLQEIQVGGARHEPEKLHDILMARGVLGAVMLAPPEECEAWRQIDRGLIACVSACARDSGLDFVGPDHEAAMSLALRHVRAGGRKRIGLALSRSGSLERRRAWIAAFYAAQLSAGCSVSGDGSPSLLICDDPEAGGLHAWLETGRHDAVIADAELPFFWRHFLRASVQGPEEFCFLDLHAPCERAPGVDLRWEDVGRKSVDLLADRILQRKLARSAEPTATLCRPGWLGVAEATRLVA